MFMNLKRTKILGWGMAISFLMIHILMICVFYKCGVTPMVIFNAFSIVFYVFMLFVLYKEWFPFFAIAIYLEVAAHMTCAVILTGWNSGFQITLIGMSVLALYSEYTGRALKLKIIRMMPACILGMFLYLGSYVYLQYHPAPYSLPAKTEYALSLLWGVIVFVIMLFVLQLLVYIAISSENQLEYQLSHDKLTGLPNRYYLSTQFENVEKENSDYWIAISDIDNFKKINDNYGHNCGDYVLKTIGEIFGKKDVLVGRWGGEEFLFLRKMEKDTDPFKYVDDIRKEIEQTDFSYEGQKLAVTMTFGMSYFRGSDGLYGAIRDADEKLYAGKHSGKNKVVNVMGGGNDSATSYQDPLTRVKNKPAYEKMIESLNWDIQNKTAQFGIVIIKLLDVAMINERYGHDKGNDYIVGASKIICQIFVNSQVFRIGGDDFAVVLTNRDYYDRDKLFEELKDRYKETAENSAVSAWERYNASCRMAVYADGDESVETVLSK